MNPLNSKTIRGWTVWLAVTVGALSSATADTLNWEKLPELPVPVGGQFAGISNGALLVVGGSHFPTPLFQGGTKAWRNSINVLPLDSDRWREAGELEHALAYGASFTTDQGLIVAGGSDGTRHYTDTLLLRWKGEKVRQTPLPPLPHPIAFTAGAVLGETLYIAGGITAPQSTVAKNNFWAFDLSSSDARWRSLEPWPGPPRMLATVAAQDGAIFVVGGCSLHADTEGKAARTYLTDAYRYDPASGWETLPHLPRPTVAAPSAGVAYGRSKVLILGGDDGVNVHRIQELRENHPGFPKEILAFDIPSQTWSKFDSLPVCLVTTTTVQWKDRLIIPGGEDRPGHRSGTVLVSQSPLFDREVLATPDSKQGK